MDTNNSNAGEEIEDEWDAIDVDARIEHDTKAKNMEETERLRLIKIEQEKKALAELQARERERKVETNKKKQKEKFREDMLKKLTVADGMKAEVLASVVDKMSKPMEADDEDYEQPFPSQVLYDIQNCTKSSENFHKLIYQTYGNLERFLVTHDAPDLIPKKLVALLSIDVALLEVPFHSHSDLLLREISRIDTYWSQVCEFMSDFFERKYKEAAFLLNVDMDSFFLNLERIFYNLILHNHFDEKMKAVLEKLSSIMDKFDGHQWLIAHGFNASRLKNLQAVFEKNSNLHKNYDIYPTLAELTAEEIPFLQENLVSGKYNNVPEYLQVQLPLLKEDFLCKLREAVQSMRSGAAKTKSPSVVIHSNVRIISEMRTVWKTKCRVIVAKLSSEVNFEKRLFLGQMLVFSSTPQFDDLIVAVVAKRDAVEDEMGDEINIEIIRTENISEIYNRSFMMLEPQTFFEPYHKVFNVLRNLNELNFPFKDQFLKCDATQKFPAYNREDLYKYHGTAFKPEVLEKWPSHLTLGLEEKQFQVLQMIANNEFSLIQGPPGTGKTFIGLEILNILLKNTKERVLVITQTNTALDKFLLGASKFTTSIARMGGQSKCHELKDFLVKPEAPRESLQYMSKLSNQSRDEIAKLLREDKNSPKVYEKISAHHRLIEEIQQLSSFYVAKDQRVIGMTTSYASCNTSTNKMLKPGIVIIEEASEVLESHVLAALTSDTKQVIMIGDHKQLKPQVASHELAKNFNFNVSLFERLIRNEFNFVTLDVQMRMRPEICDLVRGTVYDFIKDGGEVADHPLPEGMTTSLFCVDHKQLESKGDPGDTSKVNIFEAELLVKLCRHLLNSGNDANAITILTPYAAQATKFKRLLKDAQIDVRVAVLDAYQGEESEIILLSLVRSNDKGDIGFLAEENRIAVLLSRAKRGFYIAANMECLAKGSKKWRQVLKILNDKQAIGSTIPEVEID